MSISYASAATGSCVDLTSILTKGSESPKVLQLQNFLYAKGFLKAAPNGYFGAGTLAGVKAYQASIGLAQVGSVGPGTRAAIKKDSCANGVQVAAPVQTSTGQTAFISQAMSKPAVIPTSVVTAPSTVLAPVDARNLKRRQDVTALLQAIYARYNDSRGAHPIMVLDTPVELCVVPPPVISTATATEVAVLVTPASPCLTYADITNVAPTYLRTIPRDPQLATSSTLTGYTITRSQYNDITIAAATPENSAIIKATCNFNGYCKEIKQISSIIYPAPVIASSSRNLIVRDSWPKNELLIYGTGFTATNTVTLYSSYSGKKYVLGTFASANGTSLIVPAATINQLFPCGPSCNDKLPFDDYSYTVMNVGGTSNLAYLRVKGFTTSSFSARSDSSVLPKSKGVRVGSFTISTSIPATIRSLTLSATSSSSVLPGKITNFVLKDPVTNTIIATGGAALSLANQSLYENQSKIYDLYVDVDEVLAHQGGNITYGGYFTVTDTFNKVDLDLPVKGISFSISY